MMANTLVSIRDIFVNYHTKPVLKNISFDVLSGQNLAVIGKSGSGKSVLLKVIAGLQGINSGAVNYYFGSPQHGVVTSKNIGFVAARHQFKNKSNTTDLYYQQRFNSFDSEDSQTVEGYLSETVAYATSGYWTVDKVVERLDLVDLQDKELIKLSNGETKRLRLASALVKNPKLLLLDQPLNGLDIDARRNFDALLAEIAKSGITLIIATSLAEIPSVIHQVIMLTDGTIDFTTEPDNQRLKDINWQIPELTKPSINLEILVGDPTDRYKRFIKMTNVNVRYGDKVILNNINWEVKQGERWALLGHNGAGKSTLLSLIYCDNPQAYANNIVLFDKQRGTGESIWDIKKKCGFVSPELFQYFPTDNTCLQVVESGFYDTLGLFRASEPSRAALAVKWLEVLGVAHYGRQLLNNIPASAQRLCLLARALVKKPALLILDEPCQGMDHEQKEQFKNIIDTLCNQSDITIIYVTHYIGELPSAINRVLKLQNGVVIKN